MESYLEEHPPIETNIHHAKLGLIEAKRYLQQVTGDDGIRVSIKSYKYYGELWLVYVLGWSFNGCTFIVGKIVLRLWTV